MQAIAATSLSFQQAVGYKDVESYFGVHVGKPGWWFMRFYLSPKRKSLVARLSTQETKALAPEFEVQEVSTALGGEASRVVIASIEDLDKLKALVLRCYEAEAGKHPVATRKDA